MAGTLLAAALLAASLTGCGSIGNLTGLPPGVGQENVPPAVVAVAPPTDGIAPSDAPLTVTFNKAMSPDGLEVRTEPALPLGPAQWSDDARTVTVRPTSPLVPGVRYTARVRARDRQGNLLAPDYVWGFTAAAPTGVEGEGRLRVAERTDVAADVRLFALFAALEAAAPEACGRDPEPPRAALCAKLAGLPERVVDPVRRFLADRAVPVDRYLGAALQLGPPPEFRELTPAGPAAGAPGTPAPGSVGGLGGVLARFYASAGVAELWKASDQAVARGLEAYRAEAPALLGRAADYVRTRTLPGGRFMVSPSPLAPPGRGYLVREANRTVLVPALQERAGAVDRLGMLRPFLRMLLDPARMGAIDQLQRTQPLFAQAREVAARNGYRSWQEVGFESLVEATAIRLALSGTEAPTALRAAYARGLVLADHFAAQLTEYERTTTPLVDFYPRMLTAVDLDVELRRWAERKQE